MKHFSISFILLLLLTISCKKNIKEQSDEVYSRHLQKHVKLSILSTPVPKDKSTINLLLLNDGQEMNSLRIKTILDSLYDKDLIQPLIIVGIHAGDRMQEYGVANRPNLSNQGSKAGKYAEFIDNELYALVKKKATVRKFKTVVMAGYSMGGLSAFDIAWDHADKIDKVAVFSGSFWWRDKDLAAVDYSDDTNRIMIDKIRSSRKKPKLQYWFYAGGKEEKGDRDNDGTIDVIDDTKDLIDLIKSKNVCSPGDIVYIEDRDGIHDNISWSHHMAEFLLWAFGKK